MKQIYYVIQALIHGRSSNIIKVVSLGLGLTMSILLFSRVVYEQSFDTCFKDHDKLYQLWNIWTVMGNLFLLVNILSVQLRRHTGCNAGNCGNGGKCGDMAGIITCLQRKCPF